MKEIKNINNTEQRNYLLGPIQLGRELQMKNRELTKLLSAANERIKTIPNATIMFNQIILLESKGSSEIENIVTTNDELYKEMINISPKENNASKTLRIRSCVKHISKIIDGNQIIRISDILALGVTINGDSAGFRPTPGTKITNSKTNEVIHTPPQSKDEVSQHMAVLIKYINEGGYNDPITDSLLIHHAYEWIHPFIDGNGRTGRVLIGAYLKLHKELDHIFLPISYFINMKRDKYYEALERMTNNQDYEFYLETMYGFMADAASYTLEFVREYDNNRNLVREKLLKEFNKYYGEKYLNCLFYNAYTTPSTLVKKMELNFRTVKKIIDFLVAENIFKIKKEGKTTYYINKLIAKGD